MDEPVVVAGAGIGGLTAALLLARAGRPVTVRWSGVFFSGSFAVCQKRRISDSSEGSEVL